jgi:uncharacterized protein (DUF885 family)
MRRHCLLALILFAPPLLVVTGLSAAPAAAQGKAPAVPDLAELLAPPTNDFQAVLRHIEADRGNLLRFYPLSSSPTRQARLQHFYQDWSAALAKLDAGKLDEAGQAEHRKLSETVEAALHQLKDETKAQGEAAPLVPFAATVIALEESRQRMDQVDAARAAGLLQEVKKQLQTLSRAIEAATRDEQAAGWHVTPAVAQRAAATTAELRAALGHWFNFYNAYDPVFTWWLADVHKEVDKAFKDYAALLKDKGPGAVLPAGSLPAAMKLTLSDAANPRPALPGKASDAPDLAALLARPASELRAVVQRYRTDRQQIARPLGGPGKGPKTAEGKARLKQFDNDWLAALEKLDFDKLSRQGRVDYLLLRNYLVQEVRRLDLPPAEDGPAKKDASGIAGRPIGRAALVHELAAEMIGSTPEELLDLADREFAWCEAEMKRASQDMGFGDDWLKAVEKVKTLHVGPGQQPQLIRDLAWEAIAYLQKHDLMTVPPLAAETWRMEMMSPERQLVNPFFTGGEVISVSFPTNTMSYEARLQSMRGNNVHFARATVHHELIPGHRLQFYVRERFNSHRQLFATPFWLEGWALYWELRLYERGFARTPEDRVGFLFWRMHRCARIQFSLNFHLGKWTPQECIDFLVKRVGHEPANAAAEVRRSFAGNYGALYQAAYLLGGLQLRALHKEVVGKGKMSERAFHDAVLHAGNMPVAMVQALLTPGPLGKDFAAAWKVTR